MQLPLRFVIAILASALFVRASDLNGNPVDVLDGKSKVTVLLYVRTDCPITNRYAPELQRIAAEYEHSGVRFWFVYPGRDEAASTIQTHVKDYNLPGTPLRDPDRKLTNLGHATVSPEAAVFDQKGDLLYHGRIDDSYTSISRSRHAPQIHDLEDAIAAALAGKPIAHPETRAIGCSLIDVQ